jgi:quinol monooxygenase YgiN
MTDDVEIWVVAGQYQARSGKEAELGAVLAQYVVLTRGVAGCRNVDLVASASTTGKLLVVEKWDDPEAQRAHMDDPIMVDMAKAASPLLTTAPDLDLYEAISAHDLE